MAAVTCRLGQFMVQIEKRIESGLYRTAVSLHAL
jgi:hypothetical protein